MSGMRVGGICVATMMIGVLGALPTIAAPQVWDLRVYANGNTICTNFPTLPGKQYSMAFEGTAYFGSGSAYQLDAGFVVSTGAALGGAIWKFNDVSLTFPFYRTNHVYYKSAAGTDTPFCFRFTDSNYADNSGSILVKIRLAIPGDVDGDNVVDAVEGEICGRMFVRDTLENTVPAATGDCDSSTDFYPSHGWRDAPLYSVDGDDVPDFLEPTLCAFENQNDPADGTCDGVDYHPPAL